MSSEPMKGIDFSVQGVVQTPKGAYVVLIDEPASMYFPVRCELFQAALVETILKDEDELHIQNYGIYFSFLSVFKAHDMFPTQIAFTVDKRGEVTCALDIVEENELGVKVSRIPMLLPDAVAISALGTIPIVVYGSAGTNFVFKIGKDVPKQNIFSFVCEEIAKSERLSAIGGGSKA